MAAMIAGALALTACGSSGGAGTDAATAKGPITIWYSNNATRSPGASRLSRPGTPPTPTRR